MPCSVPSQYSNALDNWKAHDRHCGTLCVCLSRLAWAHVPRAREQYFYYDATEFLSISWKDACATVDVLALVLRGA